MSTSTILYSIQQNLFRFGGPLLIVIGSTSSIMNLIVFTKDTLRKNPCTICLIAVNIINILYLYLGLVFSILAIGYDIDPSANNIVFCRFRFYVGFVLTCCETSYLILASLDRAIVASPNAGTRRRSTRRLVIIIVICLGLFWTFIHIHALFFTQILQLGSNYFFCFYQPGTYTIFITFYTLVITGTLPPVLMALLGYWTVKNIRRIGHVIHPSRATNTGVIVIDRPHTIQSKDRQLIRMLFVDILSYVICKSPLTIFYIYQQITQYREKTAEQGMIEQSIAQLTYFVFFIENCIGCYTNILVSKTFRTELKRILSNTWQ